MLDLSGLNENQRRAVEWGQGPLLVLAGPGSGKTRVLTYRIARLIAGSPDERFRILGITFTNKAAAEMRQRLDGLVSEGRERALLTTFHSFSVELLRQHGSHIGLKPDFTILSQTADRQAVLTEAIATVDGSDSEYSGERLLPAVDALLDQGVAPGGAAEALKGTIDAELMAAIYDEYLSRLVKANQLDFGSLIVKAIRLLRSHPGVAKQVLRVYKFVCVDEFQDTNAAQYELLLHLVPPQVPNLFVVADDDQVIYQWNGANPKRLRDIRDRFSMATIQLPQNYRCPKEVIDLANRLIVHNLDRAADKHPLTTDRGPSTSDVVRVKRFGSPDDEIAWVRQDVLARPVAERPNCVILARTRKLLESVVNDFQSHGLPAHISVRKTEYQSAPLRWLHASLRLANARTDREQLRRLCKAFYQLEGIDTRVEDVVAAAPMASGDFMRAWIALVEKREGLSKGAARLLQKMAADLMERGDFATFTDAAFQWFDSLKTQSTAAPEDAMAEYDDELASWKRLVKEICDELGRSEVTLHSLLQGLDLRSKEPPPPPGAVLCYTIHTAKGMEFEHVYLMGLAEDQLPSWGAVKKGDQSLEMHEERRNCFVAITRTRASLTMTYSSAYNGWTKQPSRFLREMGLVGTPG